MVASEVSMVVIGFVTIIYAVWQLNMAFQAVEDASNWAKVSYDNEVRGLWMQAQDLCSQSSVSLSPSWI